MTGKNENIGDTIIVEANNFSAVKETCWSKLRQMQKTGSSANEFIIRRLEMFEDGTCNAIIQPVKISQQPS